MWNDSSCGHTHSKEHESAFLMFTGTFIHNAFHGIVLFSAFSIDFHFWILTTLAIFIHSIPQNIANYLMNHKNLKFAYLAWFGWVCWALLTFPFIDFLLSHQFELLALIAGWIMYTALADIFPNIKDQWGIKEKVLYLLFIIIWVFFYIWSTQLVDHEHSHDDHAIQHEEHEDDHGEDNH